MNEIKAIYAVLIELMIRHNDGQPVAGDDIMEQCVEYDIDHHYEAISLILSQMMPIGSMGTVDYPFSDNIDIT